MLSMNAFEVRKYLMSKAKSIMDEADERAASDIDPLTGEPWEGSKQVFYLKYKTLLDWAGKSNDPIPAIEALPEETHDDHISRSLEIIINMMLTGEIDANTAENMLKPIVAFMDAMQRKQSEGKIDEVTNLIETMRTMADKLPV